MERDILTEQLQNLKVAPFDIMAYLTLNAGNGPLEFVQQPLEYAQQPFEYVQLRLKVIDSNK